MPDVQTALTDWANETERRCYRALAHLDIEFIPQYTIAPYRADAYLPKYKVVLEFDGTDHGIRECRKRDAIRDTFIASLGMYTLRISYRELSHDPLPAIRRSLARIGIPTNILFGQCTHSINEIVAIEIRQHMYLSGYVQAVDMLFPVFSPR